METITFYRDNFWMPNGAKIFNYLLLKLGFNEEACPLIDSVEVEIKLIKAFDREGNIIKP